MKKIIALLFLLCVVASLFVGCKDKENTTPTDVVDMTQEVTEPEVTYNLMFDPFVHSSVDYFLVFEGVDEQTPLQKYNTPISFIVHEGEKVGEAIKVHGFGAFKVESTSDELLGFAEYKVVNSIDENGLAVTSYEKLSGDTLYSIEELMERELPAYDVVYVARWAGVSDSDYVEKYGS